MGWSWLSFVCGLACMWVVLSLGFVLLMLAASRYEARHARAARGAVRGQREA